MATPTTTPPPHPPTTLGTLPTTSASPPDGDEGTFNRPGADDGSTTPLPEDGDITDDGTPGGVEIGDPVPEKDRTVRAVERKGLFPDGDDTRVDPDPNPADERH
jgi:hypothetical protein